MPVRDTVTDDDGLIKRPWRLFLRGQNDTLNIAPIRVGQKSLTGQQASIGATPVPMTVNAGLYRVSVYARRTQIATMSSELKVDIGFTESTQTLTLTTGNNTTNTLAALLTGTWMIRVDQTTTITYATTYVSVGATPMRYRLDVVVEQIQTASS